MNKIKNTPNAKAKQTQKQNLNLNQRANLRTVHTCVNTIVYKCRTQNSTKQF